MSLAEGLSLTHRDLVADAAMQKYRKVMAPRWFADNPSTQLEYINLKGNAPHGNIPQNHCLVKEGEVKGTVSIYSFKYPYHQKVTTLEGMDFDLAKLPDWLIESGYIGDNSITPDLEHQGLMTILVKEMIQRFPHVFMVGITGESNIKMRAVFEKTGATINHQFPSVVRSRNPRGITGENTFAPLIHLPLYLNTQYPPVVHLFKDKNDVLVCGAIGTSPNFPDTTNSIYNAHDQLFPNQIVGFINPETQLLPAELDYIYGQIARFKYISIFQHNNNLENESVHLQTGYKQGWVTALYQRQNS